MNTNEMKERIQAADAARVRYEQMEAERTRILEGGASAQAAVKAATERLSKAEHAYQSAVIRSTGPQEEMTAREELLAARSELEQAKDRLNAFESHQGEMLSHLGEREFTQARSDMERYHELAWKGIAAVELDQLPKEALSILYRAWAAHPRPGPFAEYVSEYFKMHAPSESDRKHTRAELAVVHGMKV